MSELTAGVVEVVRRLIETAATTESPLRCWRISLGCGHAVEYRQHASLYAPEMLQLVCDQCDTPQTAQTVDLVDLASERSVLVQRGDWSCGGVGGGLTSFSVGSRKPAGGSSRPESLLAVVQIDVIAASCLPVAGTDRRSLKDGTG